MKWKICQWKQADVQGIQDDLSVFGSAFCDDIQDSVEDMWSTFKDRINTIKDERVPSKMTQARQTHHLMNKQGYRFFSRLVGKVTHGAKNGGSFSEMMGQSISN